MSDTFGSPKYGNKTQYFKLKDGSQIFRVLPPLRKFVGDTGIWAQYYAVHYGYTNVEGKNRPFASSLVKNQKGMIEVPDAAVERIAKLKAKLDEANKAGDEKTKEKLLKLVGGLKSRYNVDKNFYLNVLDLQGNIGVLKLRYKCKKQLDAQVRKLLDKGINPISADNGRYFVFTREGKGVETLFNIEVYKKSENIEGVGLVERDVVHKINSELEERIKNETVNLLNLFKTPTSEQISQIVNESNLQTGLSPNIDSILARAKATTQLSRPVPQTETKVEAPETSNEDSYLEDEEDSYNSLLTAKVDPTTEPVVAAKPTSEKVAEMSDEDFRKYLGL